MKKEYKYEEGSKASTNFERVIKKIFKSPKGNEVVFAGVRHLSDPNRI